MEKHSHINVGGVFEYIYIIHVIIYDIDDNTTSGR